MEKVLNSQQVSSLISALCRPFIEFSELKRRTFQPVSTRSANDVMSPARSAGMGNGTGPPQAKLLTDKYGDASSLEVELIKS